MPPEARGAKYVEAVKEKVRAHLSEPFRLGDHPVAVGVSIGHLHKPKLRGIYEQGHGQKKRLEKEAGKDTDGKAGGEKAKENEQAISIVSFALVSAHPDTWGGPQSPGSEGPGPIRIATELG